MKPEDGVLVAALAQTHSSEELWELVKAIARAAAVKEIEGEEGEGR